MITFRQKNYAIQLLPFLANTAMIGGTAIGLKQGADGNAAQEEANEKMLREQKKHNRAMEEAARKNSNDAIEAEKSFAALPTSVLRGMVRVKNVGKAIGNTKAGGFAKDLLGTQKENLKTAVGTGASFAALGYGGNRLAASVKDHKENNDEGNKSFLKKAALGTAAIGGSILAARKGLIPGQFGKTAQTFMTTGKGGSALNSLGKAVNPIVKNKETGKINKMGTLGKVGLNAAFLGAPTISYLAQKKSQEDMVDNTQKEFSVMAGIKAGFRALRNDPGRTITGGINKASSFIGFYGKGGTTAVQKTVGKLAEAGKASGNTWTQKTADFLGKHKKTANILSAGGTLAVGGTAMKAGSSLVDKPMKAIDKDAYKMEESENDKI